MIFMGPPGSGKGTQASLLAKRLKIPTISTGQLLRQEIKRKTSLGKFIAERIDFGQMVPDETVRKIMEKRLQHPDTKHGFILDGFPRRYEQIRDLEEILQEFHNEENNFFVIYIQVSARELRQRLGRRRVCSSCGHTYHLDINPPKVRGICDICGHPVERRKDDEPAFISRRLKIFHKENDPLLDYFSIRNVLFRINGEQGIAKVQAEILKDLKRKNHGHKR